MFQSCFPQESGFHLRHSISGTSCTGLEALHFFSNPALLFQLAPATLQLSFIPAKFGVSELRSLQACGTLPAITPVSEHYRVGVMIQTMGQKDYSSFTPSLHTAFWVSESLQLGVTVAYSRFNLTNTSAFSTWAGTLGVLWNLDSLVYAGLTVSDLWFLQNSPVGDFHTQDLSVNFGTHIAPQLSIDVGATYGIIPNTIGTALSRSAIHIIGLFTLHEQIRLRLVWSTNPIITDLTLYLGLESWLLTYSAQVHLWLGITHRFGLQYSL